MFLKKTGAELELLPDIHVGIHLFMKRGIWEGILMVIKRYPKANNPLVLNYDPSKPNRYIMYLGKSYHYGWAMSKALTTKDWKCRHVIPTEEDILKVPITPKKFLRLIKSLYGIGKNVTKIS